MALGDILNAAQIGHDPLRARMQGRFSNGKNEIAIPLIGNHLRECSYSSHPNHCNPIQIVLETETIAIFLIGSHP